MNDSRDRDLVALGLLAEPARRALYGWVVAQGRPVGREEAANALGLTRALATFHLDRLANGGLLESGYRRLTGRVGPGAGRPARVYWRGGREVSVSVPERRYERVAALFASALERLGAGSIPAPLAAAARELGEQLGRTPPPDAPGERLTSALAAGGYEPVVDDAGSIRLRNCPFKALADTHRELVCHTNLAIGEGVVSGSGATGVRPVLDPQPDGCCVVFEADQSVSAGSAAGRHDRQDAG
jgi:predicted ArsR family transcriptional regulator